MKNKLIIALLLITMQAGAQSFKDTTVYYDSAYVTHITKTDTIKTTSCHRVLFWLTCKPVITTIDYTIPVFDTAHLKKTIRVATAVVTKIGIMPFKVAAAYNAGVTRDELNLQYYTQQPGAIARVAAYNQDSVIVNVCNKNIDLSLADFMHDTTAFKLKLIDIVKRTGIKQVVIENENDDINHYYKDSVSNYINEVLAAIHALQPLGVTVYNGGFVKIRFWYYMKTHDTDFFNACIPDVAKKVLLSGGLAEDSANIQKQINAFKGLPGFKFNTHQLYVTDVNEFPGLHRMFDFFNNEVGDYLSSNEAGTYATSPELVSGLVKLAKDENMYWLILYSGDGTNKAAVISKTAYDATK